MCIRDSPLVSVEDGVRTGLVGLLPDERLHASAGAGGGVVDGCRGTGSLVVGNNLVDGVQLSRGTRTGDAATGAGGLERGSVSRGTAGLGGGAGSRGGLGGRGRTGTLVTIGTTSGEGDGADSSQGSDFGETIHGTSFFE